MDMPPIRVLIVEDHEMVRNSLGMMAEVYDDIDIVGQAANGDEAIRQCGDLKPDVVLLDLHIPLIDGITVARVFRDLYPLVRVVILTYSKAADDIAAATAAGVSAYLVKDVSIDVVADAIRAAMQPPAIQS